MTNKELQELLKEWPDDTPIKLLPTHELFESAEVIDFEEEHILHSSIGSYVDDEAPEDEWDTEDGKIIHAGQRYLLINPVIF